MHIFFACLRHLENKNYKAYYLAFLRVAISVFLLKEVIINLGSMDILYGHSAFLVPPPSYLRRLPGGIAFVRQYYLWFFITYTIVLCLNIFGIGRWVTALTVAVFFDVLQKMNVGILNGGDRLAKLVLIYLVFASSYQYFVFKKSTATDEESTKFKNLLGNLAALSIMLQLCVSYFSSGLAKLITPMWLNGEAGYYALSIERFSGTPFNSFIVQQHWLVYILTYATLFFEVLFPVLIWFKKIRKPLLAAGLIFHAGIYIFMMIYGFQLVFILLYGLFLPNEWWLNMHQKVSRLLKSKFNFTSR